LTKPITSGQLAAVAAGNALEFYDFTTFAFFAIQIGQSIFPGSNSSHKLLLSLATFGVGFLTRPLGGIVIGNLGDRLGRKPAIILCFGLMGAAILGMALTPSYSAIGYVAPIFVVFFRLVQGFALGGAVGPATAFLLEAAPVNRRGLYVSLQFATQNLSILAAGVIGLILANSMSAENLSSWGWRVALLIGVLIVPLGLFLQNRLPETLHAASSRQRTKVTPAQLWIALLGVFMLAYGTISTYTMNYLVTFATGTLGLPPRLAFGATATTGFAGMLANPVGGILGDRYGRRPVMLIALGVLACVALPSFIFMSTARTPIALYSSAALMATLLGLGIPSILVSLSESLPQNVRSGGIGMVYAFSISLFGGTAQFIVTWLIGATGSPLAPAWYLLAAALVGLTAISFMHESAPSKQLAID
jgi:MHS family citrate/tricarballylate:H+ symporter-like MFS transporter